MFWRSEGYTLLLGIWKRSDGFSSSEPHPGMAHGAHEESDCRVRKIVESFTFPWLREDVTESLVAEEMP